MEQQYYILKVTSVTNSAKKIVFCAVFSFIPNIYFSGYRINADVITLLLELVGGGGGSDDDRAVAAHTKSFFVLKC